MRIRDRQDAVLLVERGDVRFATDASLIQELNFSKWGSCDKSPPLCEPEHSAKNREISVHSRRPNSISQPLLLEIFNQVWSDLRKAQLPKPRFRIVNRRCVPE